MLGLFIGLMLAQSNQGQGSSESIPRVSIADQWAKQIPQSMQFAIEARQYVNYRIQWTETNLQADGIIRYTMQHHPDRELLRIEQTGKTPDGVLHPLMRQHLRVNGEYWITYDDNLSASIMETGIGDVDPRTMGFSDRTRADLQAAIHSYSQNAAEWTEVFSDGVFKVTATENTLGSLSRREWTINPAKGFQVESYQSSNGGKTTAETFSVLEQDDNGIWFPSEVYSFNSAYDNGETPLTVIEVTDRRINDDSLPIPTPTDIGVHPGTNVYRFNRGSVLRDSITGKPQLMGYIPEAEWHGDGWPPTDGIDGGHLPAVLVAWKKLVRYERDGKIQINSGIRDRWSRMKEEQQAERSLFGHRMVELGVTNAPYDPKLWEEYVKRFIARYKLSDAQTAKAWEIHKQCANQAERHLARHRSEYDTMLGLQRESREIPVGQDRTNKLRDAAKAKWELLEPVKRIFEKQLKRRLLKLPTRNQLKNIGSGRPKRDVK